MADKTIVVKQEKTPKKIAKKAAKKQVAKLIGDPTILHARMAAESRFLASVLDPFASFGAKVPDNQMTPSGTVHLRGWGAIPASTSADPIFGFAMTTGQYDGATTSLYNLSTTSTGGAMTWNPIGPKPYSTQLGTIAQAVRVVSAGLRLNYLGSELNLAGKFVPFCIPRASLMTFGSAALALPTSFVALEQLTYSDSVPCQSNRRQCSVRVFPNDTASANYGTPYALATNTNPGLTATAGLIGIVFYGGPTVQCCDVEYCENVEFQPLNNLVNLIQPTASRSDPIESAVASNVMAEHPELMTAQTKKSSSEKAEGLHLIQQEKQELPMFERILAGGEAFASSAAKVSSTLAPLLALL